MFSFSPFNFEGLVLSNLFHQYESFYVTLLTSESLGLCLLTHFQKGSFKKKGPEIIELIALLPKLWEVLNSLVLHLCFGGLLDVCSERLLKKQLAGTRSCLKSGFLLRITVLNLVLFSNWGKKKKKFWKVPRNLVLLCLIWRYICTHSYYKVLQKKIAFLTLAFSKQNSFKNF